jgi:hypothetical protein
MQQLEKKLPTKSDNAGLINSLPYLLKLNILCVQQVAFKMATKDPINMREPPYAFIKCRSIFIRYMAVFDLSFLALKMRKGIRWRSR